MAVAAKLAHINGHVKVRGGFVGVGFPAKPAKTSMAFTVIEVGSFLAPLF